MKRINFIISGCMSALMLLMSALLLTGCSSDNDTVANATDGSPLELKAAVVSGLATRSTTASDNAWTVGDIVTVLDGSNSTAYQYTISDASTGKMTGAMQWADGETQKTITGWSYGGRNYTTVTPALWNTSTDQSTNDLLQANDFLYSPAQTVNSTDGGATLTFVHAVSQILVRIICADGSVTSIDKIGGVHIKAKNTSTFSYTDGAITWTTPSTAAADITPLPGTQTGYLITETALVIPQDMSGSALLSFVITNADNTTTTYTYTPGTGKALLATGNKYIFNIIFNATNLTIQTVTAASWSQSDNTGTVTGVSTVPLSQIGAWGGGGSGSVDDRTNASGVSTISWTKTDADGSVTATKSNIPLADITDWTAIQEIGALVDHYSKPSTADGGWGATTGGTVADQNTNTNVNADWTNGGAAATTEVSTQPSGANSDWGSAGTGSTTNRDNSSGVSSNSWTDGGTGGTPHSAGNSPVNSSTDWGSAGTGNADMHNTASGVSVGTWTGGTTGAISSGTAPEN